MNVISTIFACIITLSIICCAVIWRLKKREKKQKDESSSLRDKISEPSGNNKIKINKPSELNGCNDEQQLETSDHPSTSTPNTPATVKVSSSDVIQIADKEVPAEDIDQEPPDPVTKEENIVYNEEDIDDKTLDDLVPHLKYKELVAAFPKAKFPPEIYECSYCKKIVKAEAGGENPTSAIYQHIERKHTDKRKIFEVIDNIGRIRTRIIKNLPECYCCKICNLRLEAHERRKHLLHFHREELI